MITCENEVFATGEAAASAPASGSIVTKLLPLAPTPVADSLAFPDFLLAFSFIV